MSIEYNFKETYSYFKNDYNFKETVSYFKNVYK